tara:strand:+ start:158 stop:697 length:540 start_codon:yes stop_codon:yes gene_type:complete
LNNSKESLFKNYLITKNLPNILTILRIILILPIIFLLESNNKTGVWYLIIVAGITDYLDGFIARKYKLQTKYGSIIDPLADKIIIIIPLIWLCKENIIPYWSISLITIREFMITAFRSLKKDGLPALRLGKYKTLFLFVFLIIIFSPIKDQNLVNLGLIIYWLGFTLNISSLFNYLIIK